MTEQSTNNISPEDLAQFPILQEGGWEPTGDREFGEVWFQRGVVYLDCPIDDESYLLYIGLIVHEAGLQYTWMLELDGDPVLREDIYTILVEPNSTERVNNAAILLAGEALYSYLQQEDEPEPEELEVVMGKPLTLLPAAPGKCPECADDHAPEHPHTLGLFYSFRFLQVHGRSPTWEDAAAHCSPEAQKKWVELKPK